MRWYVSKGGETTGPVEEAQVVEWVRAGLREATVRDEAGGPWAPLAQSPFAEVSAASATAAGEVLGTCLVLAPLLSTGAIWLWAASLPLARSPGRASGLIVAATVGITALGVAIDASLLGMGTRLGAGGRKENGPIAWFVGTAALWGFFFPFYLRRRKHFGARSLWLPGLAFGSLMLLSAYATRSIEDERRVVRRAIDESTREPREFAAIADRVRPQPPTGFDHAKALIAAHPPTSEVDLIDLLGAPTLEAQANDGKVLSWDYGAGALAHHIVAGVPNSGKVSVDVSE